MEKIRKMKIITKSLLFLVVSAGIMLIYETTKQILLPQITIWSSHILTILFVSILSSSLSYFYFLSAELKSLYKKEIEIRLKFEKELMELNSRLEETVEERTSELQKMNIDLQLAKEQADESNRLKTIFLQNMSHEVRSPLNAILGFSHLIELESKTNETLMEYSAFIKNRGNDLLLLIDEILEASILEAGKLPVNITQFNLAELIAEIELVFGQVQLKLNKPDIKLKVNSECDINTSIRTDKNKLRQILTNLIHNAYKFTNSGIIELGCCKTGEQEFLFYVSDTGIGIDEENLSHIFERFVQIENYQSTKYGGSGLGLSIVKSLVELLGGTIHVRSVKDKGSKFTFTIADKV